MADVPISNDCVEEIERAYEAAQTRDEYAKDLLQCWMNSKCPEVKAIAFYCLFERYSQCEQISQEERDDFFVQFLRTSILEDCGNEWRVNRFDALLYCQSWILQERKRERFDRVKCVADLLAQVCSEGPDEIRQSVVDVVLEHVFQDGAIIKAFNSWRCAPHLAGLYDEANDLAQKWLEMRSGQ